MTLLLSDFEKTENDKVISHGRVQPALPHLTAPTVSVAFTIVKLACRMTSPEEEEEEEEEETSSLRSPRRPHPTDALVTIVGTNNTTTAKTNQLFP